jgi:hypothetical protein
MKRAVAAGMAALIGQVSVLGSVQPVMAAGSDTTDKKNTT